MEEAYPGYRVVNLKPVAPIDSLIDPRIVQAASTIEKYGELWTDYKFWSDETSLWNTLADIYFLEAAVEESMEKHGWSRENCWVAGILLRCVERDGNTTVPSFERIGWLRICTNTTEEQWKPLGTDTTFLFV